MPNQEYPDRIESWRRDVEKSLRAANSWLALAGLYWLHDGTNTIGSDPVCDVVLPRSAPPQLAILELEGSQVRLRMGAGSSVQVNGVETASSMLKTDQDPDPSYVTLGEIRILIVSRPRGIGVRVWDNARPERRNHPPREWYAIEEKYRIPGVYTRFAAPRIVEMPDTFGERVNENMDGEVEFELGGQIFRLLASELSDHKLYIQFSDLTSGKSTYPSGRYHYTDPHTDGRVFLDFNKAYNPPCAFTEFATCTFAPLENRLKASIKAGEKFSGHRK
jgi:uncharacterized protein